MLLFRRLLILSHRYVGIAISLVVVVWFASGIVMIYAGAMPRLDPQLRLERLPALDLSRVHLTPGEAAQRAGEPGATGQPTLTTVLDRPAYRFQGPEPVVVFADTGEMLAPVDAATAQTIAANFLNVPRDRVALVHSSREPDQWTLSSRSELHKLEVDGVQIYVSAATAEIAQLTTRKQRALAWAGTIPHWIYFTAIRTNPPLWFKVIVWLSALACALSMLGIVLTFTQLRISTPFRWSLLVPYRGWMRWHYILGACFGVFALTWSFSGLLSMEPFAWTRAAGLEIRRDVFSGGALELANIGTIDAAKAQDAIGNRTIKEVGFTRIHAEDYLAIATPQAPRLLVNVRTLALHDAPFATDAIVERLRAALPAGIGIAEQTALDDYDSYYYSRGREAPLPVLRFKLDDSARTWIYVDPQTSGIVRLMHRNSRVERWLYNGLHSLDFKFWYSKRPLWDIGMIVLLLGGLAMSLLGLYLGIRRLARDLTRQFV